jgi:hypothetical protein
MLPKASIDLPSSSVAYPQISQGRATLNHIIKIQFQQAHQIL